LSSGDISARTAEPKSVNQAGATMQKVLDTVANFFKSVIQKVMSFNKQQKIIAISASAVVVVGVTLAVVFSAIGDSDIRTVTPDLGTAPDGKTQSVSSEEVDPSAKLLASLTKSDKYPAYPGVVVKESNFEVYLAPDIIYSTTGDENGLPDLNIMMYAEGKITSFDTLEDYDIAHLETDKGTISLMKDKVIAADQTLSKQDEWTIMEVGDTYGIFFLYVGYAEQFGTPIGVFTNIEVAEGVTEEDIAKLADEKTAIRSKAAADKLITVYSVSVSKPNSAGGVNATVSWKNNSNKEIKYITFGINAMNAVGDRAYCEIRDYSYFEMELTGPFKKGKKNKNTEKNAWYNEDIVKGELETVKITYMDGTSELIRGSDFNCKWY
jgi:hypothetical protein